LFLRSNFVSVIKIFKILWKTKQKTIHTIPEQTLQNSIFPMMNGKNLAPDLYAIAREAATERPFTGKYNEFDELGEYYCAVCGNHLFRSIQIFQQLWLAKFF
jgi:hypothetical protein